MTLDKLRPLADRLLVPCVDAAERLGLSSNIVSIIAFGFAGLAGLAYILAGTAGNQLPSATTFYLLGTVFVFCNGWLDLLDGALARRRNMTSAAGDLLDHVLDRYADIVIIAGLAIGATEPLIGFLAITGVLMTSYLGTQAEAVGLDRVYGGLLGRADRLAIIGAVTVGAAFYSLEIYGLTLVGWLLVFLAIVGHLTALQRFYHAITALT